MGKFDWRALHGFALVGQLGLTIVLPLAFFIWLSQLAARYWGASAVFLLLGIFTGLFVGFSQAYRILMKKK